MVTSYTILKDRIQIFCDNHYQIKKFGGEFQAELNNFATKDEKYPILYISPVNQRIFENTTEFDMDVYCFDIIQEDRANINTIVSDTNLILNDLYNYYKEGYDDAVDVIGSPYLTPLNNQLLDYAAGWVMRITFTVNNYTACQIPFIDGIPYVVSNDCQTDFFKYLTCETVTGCTTLQEYVAEQIAAASGVTVTGFTYEASNNTLSIEMNNGSTFDAIIAEMSGMTFNGTVSATTYYGDGSNLTGLNATEVTGFTFNQSTYQVELDQSNDNNFTIDLSILASDMTVTGGTYNNTTGTATFTNNSGGTFQVTGFLTGFTDIYTTGATYNQSTGEATFTRNDGNSYVISNFYTGYTLTSAAIEDALGYVPISADTNTYVTGSTYNPTTKTLTLTRNDGINIVSSGWTDTNYIPSGGTTGQIIAKIDNTNYNIEWIDNYTSQVKHLVKAGEVLTKGQAVYISSADGTNMIAMKASNTSESTSSQTLGIVAQDLALNATGYVITEGLLAGTGGSPLNTNSANVGDPIWLGSNGAILFGAANKPVAPAHLVYLGIVTRKSATVGEIFIRVSNGWELEELHNVLITSPSNNDRLVYNNSTSLWENKPVAAASTGTVVAFSSNIIYNSVASPATGNITDSLTNARIGIVQKIYHNNGTAPTFPVGWVKLGSGTYVTSTLNIIYAEWVSGTRVEYWIVQ